MASMTAATEVSMGYKYSRFVNMSSVHIMEIESARKIVNIHDMGQPKTRDLAKRLAQVQAALGLTSAEICREIGIKQNRWSQYLPSSKQQRRVTMDVVLRLKARFGITTDWIYAGDPSGLPDRIRVKISPTAA